MEHKQQLLDVRRNGAFIFNDTLLVDHRQQHLAEILNELLAYQNRLEHMVRAGLKHDDRLLGQEKANIVNIMQAIIRNLTTLHLKLYDPDHPGAFPGDLLVSLGHDGYLIKGHMDPKQTNIAFSMEIWVKTYLETSLEKLVAEFQAAAKDHVFTVEEKAGLVKSISEMLVQSIQAFYLMRTGAVFK